MRNHQFISIDKDLSMSVETSGNGPNTLLFIPGWTMSTAVFDRQLDYFESSSEFRFICYDPRGQGLSSKTEYGNFYEQHGRDLNHLVECLELTDFVLAGWSFGTLEALAYINQFGSDRLSGLVMLDGPPRATGSNNQDEWVTYEYDDADGSQAFYTLGRLQNPDETNEVFVRWMLENKNDVEAIEYLLEITRQMPDNAAVLLNAASVFLDYSKDLANLEATLPLCYIMREDQAEICRKWSQQFTPSAEIHGFGEHLMFRERHEQFNQVLVEFSRRCFTD